MRSRRPAVSKIRGGVPAAIDFNRSVLRPSDISEKRQSEPKQPSRLRSFVAWHVMPYNERAAANAERLLAELRKGRKPAWVLVVGGGSRGAGTEALYEADDVRLVAFDLYASPDVQLIADAHQMPFAEGSFDGVWIQAVLEHVLEPQVVVAEIERVLRKDGLVYAETPFLQGVHEAAYDFTRFTDSGHRWLFRNFEALDSGVVQGPFTVLLWSINYAARGLFRSFRAGLVAKLLFFWLKYFDRLVPERFAVDGASGLYFLGRKSGAPLSPAEVVQYYRGSGAGPRR